MHISSRDMDSALIFSASREGERRKADYGND